MMVSNTAKKVKVREHGPCGPGTLSEIMDDYWNLGFEVLPISGDTKSPLCPFKNRTGLPQWKIGQGRFFFNGKWYSTNKDNLNVAVLVPDGLLVADIDDTNPDEALKWFLSLFPKKEQEHFLIVKTPSGGYHVYMLLPDEEPLVVGTTGLCRERGFSIDFRGWQSKNYVLAPGSETSSGSYKIIQGSFSPQYLTDLPFVSSEILDELNPRDKRVKALLKSTGEKEVFGLNIHGLPKEWYLDKLSRRELAHIKKYAINAAKKWRVTSHGYRGRVAAQLFNDLYSGMDLGHHEPEWIPEIMKKYYFPRTDLTLERQDKIIREAMKNPEPAVRGYDLLGWWEEKKEYRKMMRKKKREEAKVALISKEVDLLDQMIVDGWWSSHEPSEKFSPKMLVDAASFVPEELSGSTGRSTSTRVGKALSDCWKALGLSRKKNSKTKSWEYWLEDSSPSEPAVKDEPVDDPVDEPVTDPVAEARRYIAGMEVDARSMAYNWIKRMGKDAVFNITSFCGLLRRLDLLPAGYKNLSQELLIDKVRKSLELHKPYGLVVVQPELITHTKTRSGVKIPVKNPTRRTAISYYFSEDVDG